LVTKTRSVDHLVWVVRDLEIVGSAMERLGFDVMPIMRHARIGTSNRIIQLHDNYLEFVAEIECSPKFLADRLMPRLELENGLAMVSVTSSDLQADHDELTKAGIETAPILNATRAVPLKDGSETATQSSSFYTWNPLGSSMSFFRSQHMKPEAIWIPEYQSHPNGAQTVDALVYVTADPLAHASYFATLFGVAPSTSENSLRLTTARGEIVEIITREEALSRYGEFGVPEDRIGSGCCAAVQYRVTDLAALQEILDENAVSYKRMPREIIVAANACAGVTFIFHDGRS
jgi:hypothetical protein